MKNKIILMFIILCWGIALVYSDPIQETADSTNDDQNANQQKTFYLPTLSYKFISFDDFQLHSPTAGLSVIRFNPAERDNLFAVSALYSPQIATEINPDFPDMYHNATVMVMQKWGNHSITGAFMAITDKPIYGGSRTFMGMAGYTNNLVKGEHFSMSLGGMLLVMDVGVTLDNGMPWLLWPIPAISLMWEYDWITFGFMNSIRMTIGPKYPFSLVVKATSGEYDASLWYRYFKNENPANEIFGVGVGAKREKTNVMISDGGKYGIEYNAIYGAFRLFRFFEASGGWVFDGKEGYEKISLDALFNSSGYTSNTMYDGNVGNGYYVSVSFRMGM